jgi:hypothetical protein
MGMADWAEGVLIALYALLNFAIIWGYYLVFELVWRGQTPGKRGAAPASCRRRRAGHLCGGGDPQPGAHRRFSALRLCASAW